MLQVSGLTKLYPPDFLALDSVSLEAEPGALGLLGPNGAGKSTFMEILAANLDFEGGAVTLGGVNIRRSPRKWRKALGYLPQIFDFPPHITGREMLFECAYLLGYRPKQLRARVDSLLEQVNLAEAASRFAANYSRGMKQRLGLAMALLHEPDLLLLDEPTAGLDPLERVVFRELLLEAAKERHVIVSTHIVPDIERSCEDIAVLAGGRILFHGTRKELAAKAEGAVWTAEVPTDSVAEIEQRCYLSSIRAKGSIAELRMLAPEPPVESAKPAVPGVEDGYLRLVK